MWYLYATLKDSARNNCKVLEGEKFFLGLHKRHHILVIGIRIEYLSYPQDAQAAIFTTASQLSDTARSYGSPTNSMDLIHVRNSVGGLEVKDQEIGR